MKTNQTARAVESQELRVESRHNAAPSSSRSQLSTLNYQLAFTLMELLVVITIIGVLAAFLVTIGGVVNKKKYITETQAEMGKLKLAIESYHETYRFYPPSSTDSQVSQLYYELMGTTKNTIAGIDYYVTLDSSTQIKATDVPVAFPGVKGFVNCTKGSGEDASPAKSFISGLSPREFGNKTNNNVFPVSLLLGAAGGPDKSYLPFGVADMNPWRYVCPGTNNPNSYDLWMQLSISGKKYLICNWNTQPLTGSPLP